MWEAILKYNAQYFLLFGLALVAVVAIWARLTWSRDESIYASRKPRSSGSWRR
jgi:hypothetical protein